MAKKIKTKTKKAKSKSEKVKKSQKILKRKIINFVSGNKNKLRELNEIIK